jgi:hypothetical protein
MPWSSYLFAWNSEYVSLVARRQARQPSVCGDSDPKAAHGTASPSVVTGMRLPGWLAVVPGPDEITYGGACRRFFVAEAMP